MYLYFYQTEELLEIISKNQLVAFGDFGADFVTIDDKSIMLRYGVDFNTLYVKNKETVFNPFNFGMLAESLRVAETSNFTYEQLKEFVKKGKYIPLSERDKLIIEYFDKQAFKELLSCKNFQLIKEEIIDGIKEKKTARQIASNIGHKTGEWGLEDIIDLHQKNAWELAQVEEIKKRNPSKDPLVYKWVSKSGCCKHCTRLYLTNGLGSEPILYRLSVLVGNGSNELTSPSEWKPSILPNHKFCSCAIKEKDEGFLWDNESQSFNTPDPEYKRQTALKRPLIRIIVSGKEFFV